MSAQSCVSLHLAVLKYVMSAVVAGFRSVLPHSGLASHPQENLCTITEDCLKDAAACTHKFSENAESRQKTVLGCTVFQSIHF